MCHISNKNYYNKTSSLQCYNKQSIKCRKLRAIVKSWDPQWSCPGSEDFVWKADSHGDQFHSDVYSQYILQLIVVVSQDISTSKWKGTGWEGIDGLGEKGQGLGEENLRDKWCYDIDRHTFGQQYDKFLLKFCYSHPTYFC